VIVARVISAASAVTQTGLRSVVTMAGPKQEYPRQPAEIWTGVWTVSDDAPIGRLNYTVSATDRFGRTAMFAPFPNLESQLTIVE
jgi:hypothetical protein